MTVATESNTTLRPPWLHLARAVWIGVSVIALVMFVIGAINQQNNPPPSCTVPGADCGPWVQSQEDIQLAHQLGWPEGSITLITILGTWLQRIAFVGIALIIFWRRSDDWMALLLSLMLITWSVEGLWDVGALLPISYSVYAVANALFAVLPFIFPNGRFVPRWTGWLAVFFAVAFNLVAIEMLLVVSVFWIVVAAYAVIYRYRQVSNAVERQQTKWVMTGLLSSMILLLPIIVILNFFPPTQPTPERLVFMTFLQLPLSVGWFLFFAVCLSIAIFRYRLWDIDLLIRRTLIYSILSGLLALTYFGSVVLLQSIFTALTGQSSPVVLVLSTLGIAALFFPLRNRVQAFIDKRFYRRKYDAAKTLADFAATARDETDLDKLTARLVEVVDETMQPESVNLWLKTNRK